MKHNRYELLTRVSRSVGAGVPPLVGTIVGYNSGLTARFMTASEANAKKLLEQLSQLKERERKEIIEQLIDESTYPYVVLWDGGGKDVFRRDDLQEEPYDSPR